MRQTIARDESRRIFGVYADWLDSNNGDKEGNESNHNNANNDTYK